VERMRDQEEGKRRRRIEVAMEREEESLSVLSSWRGFGFGAAI
jgi:hypothetical protein